MATSVLHPCVSWSREGQGVNEAWASRHTCRPFTMICLHDVGAAAAASAGALLDRGRPVGVFV